MEQKAAYDYRSQLGWMTLPRNGGVPDIETFSPTVREQDRLLDEIANCWRLTELVRTGGLRKLDYSNSVEEDEIRAAWRRWITSHFAFFTEFAILGSLYEKSTDYAARADLSALQVWSECGSRLWAGSGALMRYGVDFSPTEEIYKGYIRPSMPAAFSGEWIREWVVLNTKQQSWRALGAQLSAQANGPWKSAEERLRAGECSYHMHHKKVMIACVPEMESLAMQYERKYGALQISEQQFATYDDWFHLRRSTEVCVGGYVETACSVFSELLGDVLAGTRLDESSLRELSEGIQAALATMAAWLGPLSPSSKHYPKALRGE